ncbi:hypothetical protein ACI3KX_00530 [Microbacterium sp. ZW CA_36]|uniref:hypothetical protein n=1 Tax=Microbacterium sp. ZW CA_36 TaxID=3378078 RepID=UPI0038548FAF
MAHLGKACFVLSDDVCVLWSATFAFWEFLATVVATGVVTVLTIYYSVKASRDATAKQLEAARKAADDERRERQSETARRQVVEDREQRTRLAGSMVRVAHQLNASQSKEPKSAERLGAEAEWAALRIAFETSGLPNASEMYEYANIRVEQASAPEDLVKKTDTEGMSFIELMTRGDLERNLIPTVEKWAREPSEYPNPEELQAMRDWLTRFERIRIEEAIRVGMEFMRKYGSDAPNGE